MDGPHHPLQEPHQRCVYLCIYNCLIMRLRSSPGGVKVSTLPGKPEVSGSIPESGLRFLFIIVYFPCICLCLDCVKRMYT